MHFFIFAFHQFGTTTKTAPVVDYCLVWVVLINRLRQRSQGQCKVKMSVPSARQGRRIIIDDGQFMSAFQEGALQGDPNHSPQTYVDGARAQYQLPDKSRPLCSDQSPGWSPDDKVRRSWDNMLIQGGRASVQMRQEVGQRKTIPATIYFFVEGPQTQRPPNRREMFKWCRALASESPRRKAVLIEEVVNGQGRPFSLPLGASQRQCWDAPSHHRFTSAAQLWGTRDREVCYSPTTCYKSTPWTIQMKYSKSNWMQTVFPIQTHEQGKIFFFFFLYVVPQTHHDRCRPELLPGRNGSDPCQYLPVRSLLGRWGSCKSTTFIFARSVLSHTGKGAQLCQ